MINPGALEKGGVGALELVAMDMKARLSYFYKHISTNTPTPSLMYLYMYLKYILFFIFLISGACIYVARLATRVLSLKLLKQH
jgi:hypothetical protein